jgi:type IV pilus biogenesis protein PilP
MNNLKIEAVLACALVAASAPLLASDEIKAPVLSHEERSYLAEESRLLRELRLAELKAKVNEAKGKGRSGDDAIGVTPDLAQLLGSTPALATPVEPVAASTTQSNLIVTSVYGLGDALVADIAVNGSVYPSRAGDTLPGGWLVKHVDPYGAVIAKGKVRKTIKVRSGS